MWCDWCGTPPTWRLQQESLARLVPQHVQYRTLRQALADYRALADDGGWSEIPEGLLLRFEDEPESDPPNASAADPGSDDSGEDQQRRRAGVAAVCERLARTGDIDGDLSGADHNPCAFTIGAPPVYDATLERAVRRFQERHGLIVDGIVGPRTIAAMNVPVADRITQIAVNMNRWRRVPDDLGRRHVFVNIPGFWLHARDAAGTRRTMRVVSGEPQTPTPALAT